MQIPLLQPESDWIAPQVLPKFDPYETLAVDLETYDPNLTNRGPGWATGDGCIVGIAIATDKWSGYLPIRHENGGNLEEEIVLRWLKRTFENHKGTMVFHNALYDVGWLKREGVELTCPLRDTMFAAPLFDENRWSYSLNNLGMDFLAESKDETLLETAAKAWGVNPKGGMWALPAKYVGPYAEQDAVLTLKLWKIFKKRIEIEGLQTIYDLECDLIPLLIEMRWRGVRIDTDRAEQTSEQLSKKEQQLLVEIKRRFGVNVDIWASASIQKAFDNNNLWYPHTEKGAPSFQGPWLEAHEHDLPKMIVEARRINKARTTFIEGAILEYSHNGRIHAEAHPLKNDGGGTVTGRFSYSNPNLQQVPARDPEIGKMIRSLFIPEEGATWGAFDYSQQEPRITVHYASLLGLEGATDAVKAYSTEGADFHQIVADMAGIPRKQAKNINLGLTYGMGQQKLIRELGLEPDEALKLLETYHRRVPFIRGLQSRCSRIAEQRGCITTLGGRKCHFDLWESVGFLHDEKQSPLPLQEAKDKYGDNLKRSFTYKALNKLIQGSAADMTKLAMRDLWKEGLVPHIQIHDELDYSIFNKEQAEIVIDRMVNCVKMRVPLVVDYESGSNWGEAE
jgi:DNA polymerase I-like protein with 3'-5' exonuclease and polymerase domains